MYEYEFVRITFGLFGKPDVDHRELVAEKAAEGWRLTEIFGLPDGMTSEWIFERPARGPQDAMRPDGPSEFEPTYQAPPQVSRG